MAARTEVLPLLFTLFIFAGCKASPVASPRSAVTAPGTSRESNGSVSDSQHAATSAAGSGHADSDVLSTDERERLAQVGQSVFEHKGCNACHSTDGTARYGASFARLWGTRVTLVDGTTRIVDEGFLRDALVNPRAVRQPGYRDVMPSFEGNVTREDVHGLAVFLQSLTEPNATGATGRP